MRTYRRQRGMTLISWILVAAVVGFIATFGLKLIPIYLEQIRIDNVLSAVEKEYSGGGATPRKVRESVATRMAVNDINAVTPEDLEVRNEDGVMTAGFDFEQRTNFMGNVDLVVKYVNFVEVKPN